MLREIARDDWGRFFESFTLEHNHWLVHVDGEKESLPLEGIVSRDGRIVIHLGADIQHHRIITIDSHTADSRNRPCPGSASSLWRRVRSAPE